MSVLFHHQTGEPVDDPHELDYQTIDKCDGCDAEQIMGTMFHAAGATGRVCPVLFLCFACSKGANV